MNRRCGTVLALLLLTHFASADEPVLSVWKSLTPETALQAARAAMATCRESGFQVAVAIIDRGGVVQVVLRDQLAGPFTPDAAVRKARTAVNFRVRTTELVETINSNDSIIGIRELPGTLMVGGGVPIEAGGSMVGAMGISGAPGGDADESCALAGIETIQELLDFDF